MATANPDFGEGHFGDLDPDDSDFDSVEAFVEGCMDDGVEEFDWRHLNCLALRLQRSNPGLRQELESYGLRCRPRPSPKRIRGYTDNPHDRWYGNPCGGGSGWEQIMGFAGREG